MKSILIFTLSVLIINLECYSDSIHTNEIFSIKPPKIKQSDEGMVLAFYSQSVNKFARNINVMIQSFDGTMEEYYEKSRDQIKTVKFQIIKTSFEKNKAFFEYTGTVADKQLHFYQMYVKNGNKFYVVTATALDIDWDNQKSELINSVNSFKLN
jgi:hypothetical protein